MAKYEEKFIVINCKILEELNNNVPQNMSEMGIRYHPAVLIMEDAIEHLKKSYESMTERKLDNKYIVCNQDEPYAGEVLKIILEGEEKKGC